MVNQKRAIFKFKSNMLPFKINILMKPAPWIEPMPATETKALFVLIFGQLIHTVSAKNRYRGACIFRLEIVIFRFVMTFVAGVIFVTLTTSQRDHVFF